MSHPRVWWITGLSGSGKSTLGHALHAQLLTLGRPAVLLDGDAVRELVLEDTGYSREARLKIARFNGRLCRFMVAQGVDVVCPTISLFHECQQWNRANIPGYMEIFIDAPLEHLRAKDSKGIYSGHEKDIVGLDIPAEFPVKPDLHFRVPPYPPVQDMVDAALALA